MQKYFSEKPGKHDLMESKESNDQTIFKSFKQYFGEHYILKIVCSCRKDRYPTLVNLICPVAEYGNRTEYNVKKIVEEGEFPEELIDLEVGQSREKREIHYK